jgi:hypothetical protein
MKPSLDDTITFILHMAKTPQGLHVKHVMDFVECQQAAALHRVQAAREQATQDGTELHEAIYWSGGFKDRRWFTDADRAERFARLGPGALPRDPNVAAPRQPITGTDRGLPAPKASPRDGAMDFAQWPSRRGDRLHFPDGRISTSL